MTETKANDAIICEPPKNIGLRGVVVADSSICKVDGEAGKLVYRGFDVTTLAQNAVFEEVVYLLLFGQLPSDSALADLKQKLAGYRTIPDELINALKAIPKNAVTMDVLQSAIPILGTVDPELFDESKEANIDKALRLIARLPLAVTAWDRIRKGQEPVQPDSSLGHAAAILHSLTGAIPDPDVARVLDICLILHAEHSFNASTFTARQIASTRAHMYAAISGAVGSLSGELHGGANARVLQMLMDIGSIENVHPYITRLLDEGGKVMGMGHAVYKVLDPRAKILGAMAEDLVKKTGKEDYFKISQQVNQITREEFKIRKGIDINANVDFYSATVYDSMGFAIDMFTPLFAISRVSGWAAHVIEEKFAEAQPKPALYRPRAEYTGHYCGPEGCEWVPKDKRS